MEQRIHRGSALPMFFAWPRAWSFLSHHGMILVALARQPDKRLRELALEVGISPRAAPDYRDGPRGRRLPGA